MKHPGNCGCASCTKGMSPTHLRLLGVYQTLRRFAVIWRLSDADLEEVCHNLKLDHDLDKTVLCALAFLNGRALKAFLVTLAVIALPVTLLLGAVLRRWWTPGPERTVRSRVSCACFVTFVNLVPSPKTRKVLSKLVTDQADHIAELETLGCWKSARWNWWCTWALILWYAGMHTATNVMKAVRGRSAT